MNTSVRRRLVIWLTLAIGVAIALQAFWQYRHAMNQSDMLFDYHLRQMTLALRDQEIQYPEHRDSISRIKRDIVVQIRDSGRQSGDGLQEWAAFPLAEEEGFADVVTPQGRWRVYTAFSGTRTIQAGQSQALREAAASRAAMQALIGPFALSLVLSMIAYVVIDRGLKPVTRIATDMCSRLPNDMHNVPSEGVPNEVVPLIEAFNALLGRLAAAQDAQRRLIADAAHALRSPLAALSLQMQQLEREGFVADASARARVDEGLRRVARLVEQLLALARSDAEESFLTLRNLRLDDLVKQCIGEALPLADVTRTDLGMVRTETVSVFGDSNILAAAASNLIDNAIRHAGSTARVDVSVYADAQHAILEVADSGPGIAEEERARVTERFYRQPGSAIGGSGLGLAIVRASVERHHGTLEFGQSAMGGLLVRMRLPLAPARDQLQSRNG